jgi:hypothetical protein
MTDEETGFLDLTPKVRHFNSEIAKAVEARQLYQGNF